jgi:uncharacterized protein YoxC
MSEARKLEAVNPPEMDNADLITGLLKGHIDAPNEMAAYLIKKLNGIQRDFEKKAEEAQNLQKQFTEARKAVQDLQAVMSDGVNDLLHWVKGEEK